MLRPKRLLGALGVITLALICTIVGTNLIFLGNLRENTLQTAEASGTMVQTSLADAVEQYEKDMIVDALKSARGNCAKAARLLGTTERIVGYKVRKYGIDPGRFRAGQTAAPVTRWRSVVR